MKDPRIEINPTLRKLGIFFGLAMIVAGLVIGWIRSGQSVQLPPTGYKKK
jgi:uncharacterized membrane protein YagU involved in acid resistance